MTRKQHQVEKACEKVGQISQGNEENPSKSSENQQKNDENDESKDENDDLQPIDVQVFPPEVSQATDLVARPNQGSRLDQLISNSVVKKSIRTLKDALFAMKSGKYGGSEGPDWRIRIDAAKLLIAYAEGEPIKRQQVATVSHTTLQELTKQVSGAPAAAAAVREVLTMMKQAALDGALDGAMNEVQTNPDKSSGQKA